MAVLGKSQGSEDYRRWRKTANIVLALFVLYGLTIGLSFHFEIWPDPIPTVIPGLLNYPGIIMGFFLNAVLSSYNLQPGMLLSTIIAWSLMGFVLYVILRFKAAITQGPDY